MLGAACRTAVPSQVVPLAYKTVVTGSLPGTCLVRGRSSLRTTSTLQQPTCRRLHSRRNITMQAAGSAAVTGTPPMPEVYAEDPADPQAVAFQQHQATAARPTSGQEARTIAALARHGVLATISASGAASGFPSTSVVEYAVDGQGQPFFAVSGLSPHTADMQADGRISLAIMMPAFKSLQDGRVMLQGRVAPVSDEQRPMLREAFLKKYPEAFYVDFGDFRWFAVTELLSARFNGGFGQARKMTVEEYVSSSPDPVAAFSAPVCKHMNEDHETDTLAMIKHYVGMEVEKVKLLDLDRLGMNTEVVRKGSTFKLRLPFSRPAEDRKGIKDAIVEMTKAARSAAKP